MPEAKAYLVSNDQKTPINYEQTTVGRLSSNLIPINDPTVSKNHATINFISSENKFYIRDNNTVNGTYLNGNRLDANKKYPLKHKDSLQFGKHINLYSFYQTQPEAEKKGKINLKDYCFQLDSDSDKQVAVRPSSKIKMPEESRRSNISPSSQIPTNTNQTKKLKIPNIEDYLELSGSLVSSNGSNLYQPVQKQGGSKFAREGRVQLPNLDNQFQQQDLNRVRREQEKRRNIYQNRQNERLARQQKERAQQQQKIRIEIQKHKKEEEMLRRQIEMQKRVREQQEKIQDEKKRIEEELVKRQQQRREKQRLQQEEQRARERKFVQELQEEKERQLQMIKQQQENLRTKTETAMRQQLQKKKKELQLEAQALARQYQTIYRQTIKKMKNDIQKEEVEIQDLQQNIQHLKEEFTNMQSKNSQVADAVNYARQELQQISGRNRAFILYASELQNKLDKTKIDRGANSQKKVSVKLRQEILNSRKLLSLKKGEINALQQEIGKLRLTLNLNQKMNYNDMLETILSNHDAIQKSKVIYFEYLREEKALKDLWQQDLQQNQHLEQQNLALDKQIQNSKKQLIANLRDNASRLTEQRLHMLKCLHYLPEQKKKAAKFLIEEMVTMEEEIKSMVADEEQTHDKIHELIVDTERKRMQNQYLSTLLFGADSTAHHFDNMKIQINSLMDRVEMERDEGRVMKRLKIAEQVQNNQIKIYQGLIKTQKLKNRWRQGLRSQKIMMAQKNPIVFFGDQLTKRQMQLHSIQQRAARLERECAQLQLDVQQCGRKRQQLGNSLEEFKRQELNKVRQSFM